MRHSYYSSVSYADYLFGTILDELEVLGLKENTIVLFMGDHGFHLGEQAQWCKWVNTELSNRVPLIIRDPGAQGTAGQHVESLVELVDVYPSLVEAAGLFPLPVCSKSVSSDEETCGEGISFMGQVRGLQGAGEGKGAIFYQRGYRW